MYKIISVTDKDGNIKQSFMDELKSNHDNLSGDFYYDIEELKRRAEFGIIVSCGFVWNDDTSKMLRTSQVEEVVDDGNIVTIVTRNSVYVFERMEENNA